MIELSFVSEQYLTQAEFSRWVERRANDLERFELLNGRIVMTPPSSWPQGELSLLIGARLVPFVQSRSLGRMFGADQGFELPSGDTVSPDVSFVSNARWSASTPLAGAFLRLVPSLVIEVLSPSTASRDRGEKKAIYERNGVEEYWLVDTVKRQVTCFVLTEGRFGPPQIFEEAQRFQCTVLAGLMVAVADLLLPER